MGGKSSTSHEVVLAVAAEKRVDPTELPPLHNSVDSDALDALFDAHERDTDGERPALEVRFPYAGVDVSVRDGEVVV